MIQIEESNPSFESCSDCIHSDDSEEICILRRCIHAVAQLNECYVPKQPTIEPERKKGRWIPLQLSIAYPPYQCSCCFQNAPMIETGCLMNRHLEALLTHFCPNCGADMREPEDIPMEYFESGGR